MMDSGRDILIKNVQEGSHMLIRAEYCIVISIVINTSINDRPRDRLLVETRYEI